MIPEAPQVWGVEIHTAVLKAALTVDLEHLVIVSQQLQQLEEAPSFDGVLSVYAPKESGALVELRQRYAAKCRKVIRQLNVHASSVPAVDSSSSGRAPAACGGAFGGRLSRASSSKRSSSTTLLSGISCSSISSDLL